MTVDERLCETLESERFDAQLPDVDALRAAGLARRTRHDRVLAAACVVVVLVAGAVIAANRSSESESQRIVTGPTPAAGTGPAPAPNVIRPEPAPGIEGVLSSWLAARTGAEDRQLVVSYNPTRPSTCPVVPEARVITHPDRVEVGLVVGGDQALADCPVVGPPHVVVELPEPLAGRPVFDLADPAVEREVLDGSTLQVPTVLPDGMLLVEERVLSNPQRQGAWSQSYGAIGSGSLIVAQSATHGRALGGAYLAAAAPDDAPATLETTKPVRTAKVAQLGSAEAAEITVAVYRELPDGRVSDVALVWRVNDMSYAMRLRSQAGLELGELVAVARSMQTV